MSSFSVRLGADILAVMFEGLSRPDKMSCVDVNVKKSQDAPGNSAKRPSNFFQWGQFIDKPYALVIFGPTRNSGTEYLGTYGVLYNEHGQVDGIGNKPAFRFRYVYDFFFFFSLRKITLIICTAGFKRRVSIMAHPFRSECYHFGGKWARALSASCYLGPVL